MSTVWGLKAASNMPQYISFHTIVGVTSFILYQQPFQHCISIGVHWQHASKNLALTVLWFHPAPGHHTYTAGSPHSGCSDLHKNVDWSWRMTKIRMTTAVRSGNQLFGHHTLGRVPLEDKNWVWVCSQSLGWFENRKNRKIVMWWNT